MDKNEKGTLNMGTGFLGIFASSPFRPLQAHMDSVQSVTLALQDFFEAVFQQNWPQAIKAQARIVILEEQADVQKREIRLHLPNSLFMPVSRSDFLRLLTTQDEIANKVKDISGLVLGRKMRFPDSLVKPYGQFLVASAAAIKQAAQAIGAFDGLLETGFRGQEAELVEAMIVTLDRLEDETDQIQVDVRAALFAEEKELDPIDAIFLYKTIDWTGELADNAQHVGHCLQLLLAR